MRNLRDRNWHLVFAIAYLFLLFFSRQVEIYLPWSASALAYLMIAGFFIWMVSLTIKGVFTFLISKFRRKEGIRRAFIYLPAIAIPILLPGPFSTAAFAPEPEIRACYEGTQNQAHVLFRKGGRFEINSSGAFGYNEWWVGKWSKVEDTISLSYDNREFDIFGNSIIIRDSLIVPSARASDTTLNKRTLFYLGFCKGLN